MRSVLAALLTACASSSASASPPELGDVAWLRNYDQARAQSKATGKPILILFDEVPGCQTCVRYGEVVLSHPLLVEAAETEFVPVAIYNNVGGHDRKILRRFREPTWNNPVVRFVDAESEALAARLAGDYSSAGLANGMIDALKRSGRPVPPYLALLAAELAPRRTERAVFSMYCFWSGEACLGDSEGVISTRTGFANGREVVEVEYDPTRISSADLAQKKCGSPEAADRIRSSHKDDKYQLRHTAWRFVPMTELQASRANALIGRRQDPRALFSGRQIAIYEAARRRPNAGWPIAFATADLKRAFDAAQRIAGS